MTSKIRMFFNELLNNPILLIVVILGLFLLIVITFVVIVLVKKKNDPIHIKKIEEKKRIKKEKIAEQDFKKNIDTNILKKIDFDKDNFNARNLSEDEEIQSQEEIENIIQIMDNSAPIKSDEQKNLKISQPQELRDKVSKKLYKESAHEKRKKKSNTEEALSILQRKNFK